MDQEEFLLTARPICKDDWKVIRDILNEKFEDSIGFEWDDGLLQIVYYDASIEDELKKILFEVDREIIIEVS
jgi:hypothetical protein